MKNFIFPFLVLFSFYLSSQCVFDESCTITPAFPNICPQQLPNAVVGEFYTTDLTFWMPVEFQAEGFDVFFDQLVVTSITGSPIGLTAELSNPNMVYYPSESEFGCATISGVPLNPGDYVITVSIVANVTVIGVGFEVPYPETFDLYLTVNPGMGGNTSFLYSPSSGCEDLNVSLEALITSDEYDVEYIWDFGNGFSSNQQFPPDQLYDNEGEYNVTLTTNLSSPTYVLNSFDVNYTNVDCWGYDAEELCVDVFGSVQCWGDPDLLVKVYDANGNLVYQTDYVTSTTASWSNINLSLDNPPYTISVWDTESWDQLDFGVQFSNDDELATFSIILEDGSQTFNSDCSSGTYSITADTVLIQSIDASELITVYDSPEIQTILNDDLYIVSVEYDDAISYQWYLDGSVIEGAIDQTYLVTESGTYHVEFTTIDGCQGISMPLDVVKCDDDFIPTLFVSDITLLTTDTDYELEWFWNGLPYGFGPSINTTNNGYYWVIASDDFGCNWSSDTIFYQSQIVDDIDNDGIINSEDDDIDGDGIINSEDDDVDGDGIPNDIDNDIDGDGVPNDEDDSISGYLSTINIFPSAFSVFPNPANNFINLKLLDTSLIHKNATVSIRNINGQLFYCNDLDLYQDFKIDVSDLPNSNYILEINLDLNNLKTNLIINR